MLFNSLEYFIFLAVVLALYYALSHRWQNYMLLAVSYFFYGYWDYRFLSLMLISTVVDFFAARMVDHAEEPTKRKLFLALSMVVNLTFLGFFKYFNFFVDSAERALSLAGVHVSVPLLYVILPAGISFYTFESMSYVIDVYRRKVKSTNNFFDFALFIAFFPKLVAGPIMRIDDLLPQIERKRIVTNEHILTGVTLILVGLFRKVVIADAIAGTVDAIFANPASHSTPELIKGIYLFALQIYCDFSGYSDIARGSSRLLGMELMLNFDHPYFSSNITEFWRRWHISLSTWFRDYLYIPLGGNRVAAWRSYLNTMIVFLVSGLWHGAAWTFVAWGGLHGLFLVIHRLFTRGANRSATRYDWRWLLSVIVTFHCVLFAWIFFRAHGFGEVLIYIKGIAALRGMDTFWAILPSIVIPWLLMLAVDIPQFIAKEHTALLRWPVTVRHVAVAAMLFLIFLGLGTRAPFIYFQF
ncbi:MAG: MBOAT family protein [Caldilineaceae bacterium]